VGAESPCRLPDTAGHRARGPFIVVNAVCGWPIECGLAATDGGLLCPAPGVLFFAHGILLGRPALFELESSAREAVTRTLAWSEVRGYGWLAESYHVLPVAEWEADQQRRRRGAGLPRARSR
jgi:hypothetical protein